MLRNGGSSDVQLVPSLTILVLVAAERSLSQSCATRRFVFGKLGEREQVIALAGSGLGRSGKAWPCLELILQWFQAPESMRRRIHGSHRTESDRKGGGSHFDIQLQHTST